MGRLGEFLLAEGCYVYVGSALGPGGLRARLRRHLSPAKHPYWHIDYLTRYCRPQAVRYVAGPQRLECTWVQLLHQAGATWPIPGFGSSDCRRGCGAHLLQIPATPSHKTDGEAGSPPAWTIETIERMLG